MENILIGFFSVVACFIAIVLIEKLFNKEGLFVWVAIATVLANIFLAKTVGLGPITASLGNIMFASTYLATDILTEKYGVKWAKKAVKLGLCAAVIFIVSSQIVVAFTPAPEDTIHPLFAQLFSITARITLSSVICYFLSNLLDVWLFEKIRKKTNGKYLWLRNNVSTIVSNCGENFAFYFIAFLGVMDVPTLLMLATTASVIEITIAACDTPFLYLSKRLGTKTWNLENCRAYLKERLHRS